MTQEARDLLQKALALPENDRAERAGNLLSSLDRLSIKTLTPPGSKRSRAALMRFNPAR